MPTIAYCSRLIQKDADRRYLRQVTLRYGKHSSAGLDAMTFVVFKNEIWTIEQKVGNEFNFDPYQHIISLPAGDGDQPYYQGFFLASSDYCTRLYFERVTDAFCRAVNEASIRRKLEVCTDRLKMYESLGTVEELTTLLCHVENCNFAETLPSTLAAATSKKRKIEQVIIKTDT
jgi:hypothetical protein